MLINNNLQDNKMIIPAGLFSMNGVQPKNINEFKEYETKLKDGSEVSLSKKKRYYYLC